MGPKLLMGLAVLGALALSACSGGEDTPGSSPASEATPTEAASVEDTSAPPLTVPAQFDSSSETWRVEAPADSTWVVDEGHLIYTTTGSQVQAVDLSSGEEVWEAPVDLSGTENGPTGQVEAIRVEGSTVLVARTLDSGLVVDAVDLSSGEGTTVEVAVQSGQVASVLSSANALVIEVYTSANKTERVDALLYDDGQLISTATEHETTCASGESCSVPAFAVDRLGDTVLYAYAQPTGGGGLGGSPDCLHAGNPQLQGTTPCAKGMYTEDWDTEDFIPDGFAQASYVSATDTAVIVQWDGVGMNEKALATITVSSGTATTPVECEIGSDATRAMPAPEGGVALDGLLVQGDSGTCLEHPNARYLAFDPDGLAYAGTYDAAGQIDGGWVIDASGTVTEIEAGTLLPTTITQDGTGIFVQQDETGTVIAAYPAA